MKLLLLQFGFLVPCIAGSVEADQFAIRQLLLNKNRAVVAFKGELAVGNDLIASLKDGAQCTLKVTAVGGNVANVDVSECPLASSLFVGQKLERSLAVEEPEAKVVETKVEQPSSSTIAQNTNVNFVPTITDIQNLPGERRIKTNLTYQNLATKSVGTYLGFTYAEIKETKNTVAASAIYGVTDRFALGMELGWLVNDALQYSYGPGSVIPGVEKGYTSRGMLDPSFAISGRVLDQQSSPYLLDLILNYSPKSGDAKSATVNTKGNALRGGEVTSLRVEFGQKRQRGSYSISANARLVGAANRRDADSSAPVKNTSFSQFAVRLTGQLAANPRLAFRGNLMQESTSSSTSSYPGTDDVKTEGYGQLSLGGVALYEIVPRSFGVSIGVERKLNSVYTVRSGATEISADTEATVVTISTFGEF